MKFNSFIAVMVEIFTLLRYFTAQVGVLLQMFRKKMAFPFSDFKESKNKRFGPGSSYIMIISELLQCHTLNLVQG